MFFIFRVTKTKNSNVTTRLIDILIKPTIIDVTFPSNINNLCENSELIVDSTNRIIKCVYSKFTNHQKTIYSYLLEIIKEINFDAFIDLKRKLFYFNDVLSHETERSTFRVRKFYFKIIFVLIIFTIIFY